MSKGVSIVANGCKVVRDWGCGGALYWRVCIVEVSAEYEVFWAIV